MHPRRLSAALAVTILATGCTVQQTDPPTETAAPTGPATTTPRSTPTPPRPRPRHRSDRLAGHGRPKAEAVRSIDELTGRHGKYVALTFDDGPGPQTPEVLKALQHAKVPATFFTVGDNVDRHPGVVRALHKAGMSVQTHTAHHADLATLDRAAVRREVSSGVASVHKATGHKPTCVRPPYNAWSTTSLAATAGLGVWSVSYDVDPRDWAGLSHGQIVGQVMSQVEPGAIVLMHDGGGDREQTVRALPQMIKKLKAKGYRFVSLC